MHQLFERKYFAVLIFQQSGYYPGGMIMPGRKYSTSSYRYGFNGQEKSDEIKGEGNSYTAEFWEYDPRTGRRWNIEPEIKKYPWNSPYACFNNNPILNKDPNGKDPITAIFEGVTAFAIEAGLDFLTGLLVENKTAEQAFNDVNWKGAAWEGAKATAISAFLPTGTQTAARLAKIGQSKIGKITASFVSNLANEAMKNYLGGKYDENGSFSFDKLSADFTNLVYTAGITTLLDAGLGGKAEELFKKLEKSNSKLAKEYEKLFKTLSKPNASEKVIEKRIKKINEAAKKLGKDAAAATGEKAKDETIKKAADETQKQIRDANDQ